jgi:effector-binding domain-containing protein
MRTYDVSFADLAAQPIAVVRSHVAHDGIGPFLGTAFSEVMSALVSAGEAPTGVPFARYRVAEDGFDVEAGFPVRAAIAPAGNVVPSTLPGGRAARVVHRGAYDQVAGAYAAALRWIDENACVQAGDAWEMYVDPPDVPEPRTEVFVPCRSAHR